MIRLKRAYEPAAAADGTRFLVERLWPRGMTKAALKLDGWLKDVAPSQELRSWYSHDVARWPEFRRRYLAELAANQEALAPLRAAARSGTLTLVFASRDAEHCSAAVLKEHLTSPRTSRPRPSSRPRRRA